MEEGLEHSRYPHRVPGHVQLLPQLFLLLLLLIVCLRAMPPALPWSLREVMLGQVTSDKCQKEGQSAL